MSEGRVWMDFLESNGTRMGFESGGVWTGVFGVRCFVLFHDNSVLSRSHGEWYALALLKYMFIVFHLFIGLVSMLAVYPRSLIFQLRWKTSTLWLLSQKYPTILTVITQACSS